MTESSTRPDDGGEEFASAEAQAAVEALEEANGGEPLAPVGRRGRGRAARTAGRAPDPSGPGAGERAGAEDRPAGQGEVHRECLAEAQAESIRVRQGAVGRAEAGSVECVQGAIGLARGEHIGLRQGAVGMALGGEVHLEQSFGRVVMARENVSLKTSGAWNVLADKVEVGPGSGVVFLVARRVEGDVRPLFDWRGALVFGAAVGLMGALVRRRRR